MNGSKLHLLLLIILFPFACTTNRDRNDESSGQNLNKEQIQDSLKAIVKTVFKNSETLNLDKALSPFITNDEFLFVSNGQKLSFDQLKNIETEYFSTLKQQIFNFTDQTYDVINDENAIAILIGTATAIQKDGLTVNTNIAETIIFKKIDGIWKIVGGHESYVFDTSKK